MKKDIRDELLVRKFNLPTADGTVNTADIDLGVDVAKGDHNRVAEIIVELPALSAANLPNADTLTISIHAGAAPAPTDPTVLSKIITGDGSAIAAQTIRFGLPSDLPRYIRANIVAAGGTGDMSALEGEFALVF